MTLLWPATVLIMFLLSSRRSLCRTQISQCPSSCNFWNTGKNIAPCTIEPPKPLGYWMGSCTPRVCDPTNSYALGGAILVKQSGGYVSCATDDACAPDCPANEACFCGAAFGDGSEADDYWCMVVNSPTFCNAPIPPECILT